MKKNVLSFLNKALGDDFLESLQKSLSKSEVFKPGTRTITDTDDLFQGLQIVPRALLSLLSRELSPMQIGEIKEIKIPGKEDTAIITTKFERDSYSGQIIQNNVKINDFLHRSLPGLGLVLMTVLELYDFDNFEKDVSVDSDQESRIQKLIDDRIQLHSLVNQVVDGKLMQRDAVNRLFLDRLNSELMAEKSKNEKISEITKISHQSDGSGEYFRGMSNGLEVADSIANNKEPQFAEPKKRSLPLHSFFENRKKKLNKKEHFIQLEKSEVVSCPDCGKTIFSEGLYSGCICFGDNNKKIHIKKSESGYSFKFGRGWDVENIEMLLEILRSKNNE